MDEGPPKSPQLFCRKRQQKTPSESHLLQKLYGVAINQLQLSTKITLNANFHNWPISHYESVDRSHTTLLHIPLHCGSPFQSLERSFLKIHMGQYLRWFRDQSEDSEVSCVQGWPETTFYEPQTDMPVWKPNQFESISEPFKVETPAFCSPQQKAV